MAELAKEWRGEYWGKDGAVAEARQRYLETSGGWKDRICLASTYYSAANRTLADFCGLRFWQRDFWKALWHLDEALGVANKSVKIVIDVWWSNLLDRPEEITELYRDYDAADVSAAVLLRYGWWFGWRYDDRGYKQLVQQVVGSALHHIDFHSDDVAPHTEAFLISHWLQLGIDEDRTREHWIEKMEGLAQNAERHSPPEQVARVYRWCAYHQKQSVLDRGGVPKKDEEYQRFVKKEAEYAARSKSSDVAAKQTRT